MTELEQEDSDDHDYEFAVGELCVACIFETEADDAAVMAAIEAGLQSTLSVLPDNQKLTEPYELSILICDDATITELNSEWRGKDYATNVLSFPASPQPKELIKNLGDMAISLPTTQREAMQMGIPVEHHLTHLAIHSLLHLLGYDHENDTDATIMEAMEIQAMAHLNLLNPYEDDRCRPLM